MATQPAQKTLDPSQSSAGSGEDHKIALVAGATGLAGRELIRRLLKLPDWKFIYGVARKPSNLDQFDPNKYYFVSCDLLDRGEAVGKLRPLAHKASHVFWLTWASEYQLDTKESYEQNKAMLSNTLNAILVNGTAVEHVSLQTGTKHYVCLSSVDGDLGTIIYEENAPRTIIEGENNNFYYGLEDVIMEKLRSNTNISSSVHRPGLLLGASQRSYFNVVGALCAYATVCKYLDMPFLFLGSKQCWEEHYLDASDARVVADQHIWSACNAKSNEFEAFNAVNDISFAWKDVWPSLAHKFGLPCNNVMMREERRYSELMKDKGKVWEEIVEKNGLQRTKIEELGNWDFIDVLFRFPGKLLVSPVKARKSGFEGVEYSAGESLLYWVERMREDRLIP